MAKKSVLQCDSCSDFSLATERVVVKGLVKGFKASRDLCDVHLSELPEWARPKGSKRVAAAAKPVVKAAKKKTAKAAKKKAAKKTGRKLSCPKCDFTTTFEAGLKRHTTRIHGGKKTVAKKKTAKKTAKRAKKTGKRKPAASKPRSKSGRKRRAARK